MEDIKNPITNENENNNNEATATSLEDISLASLSNEELNDIVKNIQLTDDDGKQIIFRSADEARIYAVQLQKNHPDIRFTKIIECFSMYAGNFWIIEPMITSYAKEHFKNDADNNCGDDFSIVDDITLLAIVEIAKREYAAQKEAEKDLEKIDRTLKSMKQK